MIHSIKKFSIVKLSIVAFSLKKFGTTAISNDNAYNTKITIFCIMTLSIMT